MQKWALRGIYGDKVPLMDTIEDGEVVVHSIHRPGPPELDVPYDIFSVDETSTMEERDSVDSEKPTTSVG